jgi:uncharacterized cupin superfamily protein
VTERAKLRRTETGLVAEGDGWYAAGLRDLSWETLPGGGAWCVFEGAGASVPNQLGIGVHVLWPGDTPGAYHAESDQEGFLVLDGSCLLVVEGSERVLRQWDYFHCPAGTRHITVGAGDGPCALLMVGARSPDKSILYPVDAVAARHGASVERESTSPREVYAGRPARRAVAAPWPTP